MKGSQRIIPVGSLDNPLPDQLNGQDTLIHKILPAFEVVQGEEGEELGAAIPNGSYRQRLACAHLTQPKIFASRTNLNQINNSPRPYNPRIADDWGQPIPVNESMLGRSFYFLNLIGTGQYLEDALSQLRDAWQAATGQTLEYPEGYALSETEAGYHFAPTEP